MSRVASRWTVAVVAILLVGGLAAGTIPRLALTSDGMVANEVRKTLEGSDSPAVVRQKLGRKYAVHAEGRGPGYFRKTTFSLSDEEANLMFFVIVVGRYHSPPFFLETTVEAQVVVDRRGAVRDVAIRRTRDSL